MLFFAPHRFTLTIGAALLAAACTVSDVEEKTPANAAATAQNGAAAATGATATPGTVPSGAQSGTATAPGTAALPAGSNMSPDSVDVGRGSADAADSLPVSKTRIEVSLAARTLTVFDGDRAVSTYRVAVGSPEWPTQTGDWHVRQVVWNPEWIPPDESWAEQRTPKKPGAPDNPLGRAQLVYDPPRTVHGTNEPASIGKAVSHGSIRLSNADVVQVARHLMDVTGTGKDDAWYRQIQQARTEKVVVNLPQRVPIKVE